jgi:hypothetical protein
MEVCCISLLLVSINKPVKECNYCVLERNPRLSLRIDIEGEMIMPFDVHKFVIEIKDWSCNRLL